MKNEKELNEFIEQKLKDQFLVGLSKGSKAICGVILDKTKNYNGTNAEKVIDDIKTFCEKSLGLPEYNGK